MNRPPLRSIVTLCVCCAVVIYASDTGAVELDSESNRLISDHPIVFVPHAQYPGDHHKTATRFQTG